LLSPLDPDGVVRKLSLSVTKRPKVGRDGSAGTSNSEHGSVSEGSGGDDIVIPLATAGAAAAPAAGPTKTGPAHAESRVAAAVAAAHSASEEPLTAEQLEQVQKEIINLSRDSPYWPDNTVVSKHYIGRLKAGKIGEIRRKSMSVNK